MTTSIFKDLIPEHIQKLTAYTSARSLYQGQFTFMDANELPFSPHINTKIPSNLNRYPDPYSLKIKKALQKWTGLQLEQLFVGSGSDEIIDLLIKALVNRQTDHMIGHNPGYSVYQILAQTYNIKFYDLTLTSDFQLPLDQIKQKSTPHTKITWICSPNNPTGNIFPLSDILKILKQNSGFVVVDEAYIEFALNQKTNKINSLTSLLSKYPRLIILRTLSKAWGLAGLRLGWLAAHPQIIQTLNKVKEPYNVPLITQEIGAQILKNPQKMIENVQKILKLKKELLQNFHHRKLITYPSKTNFFLWKLPDHLHAPTIYQKLIQNNQLVLRDRSNLPNIKNCIRVTIGTAEENKQLLQAIDHIIKTS